MNVRNAGNKTIVYLEGEINAQTGAAAKDEVKKIFGSADNVLLSFKDVVYMNSSGLRELIDLFKTASAEKKNVSLCDMSADIREMFSFTGLDKVFKIFDTESQAL